jgi:pyruvate-formate lyase-activating enzyme
MSESLGGSGLQSPDVTVERKAISTQFHVGDWERPFLEAFGDAYVEYRRRWERAGPAWRPEFPLHIDFQLQDACNMRCTFCPRNADVATAMKGNTEWINRGTKMSLEVFKQVIDEGERHGLRAINLGATSEPLIHPDIVEIVRYARQHGVFDIRIITNGLLLNEQMIRGLFEAGLTYLGVSVDAWMPETYRKVRRNDLSRVVRHAQLAMQIRQAMGQPFPRIRVSFVNCPQARGEFAPFLEFWKDKVDFVELQDFDDFGGPVTNTSFTCAEPFRRLMVWASGIVGCIAWDAEEYPYGHLHGQTIKACWDSPAAQALRDSFKTKAYNPMCLGCYGKMATKDQPEVPL